MNSKKEDFKALLKAFFWYTNKKTKVLAKNFEEVKNFLVEVLMQKRGIYQKRFWHGSIIGLTSVGILTSGVLGGESIISSTYPGFGASDPRFALAFEPFPNGPVIEGFGEDIHTDISQKPRSEILDYEVQSGDTISSIAKKFDISTSTIKWANDLKNDTIKPGQTLKTLPLTGVSHKVQNADTLSSLAKKYSAEQQAILDYPFNDIPDDFKLKVGQILIIPDGVPPESKIKPVLKYQPQYLAQGPSSPTFNAPFGAQFIWPTSGQISQYFAWYHTGIDVANRGAPEIAAADGGTIVVSGWPDGYGYGNRVVIDHGNGYRSLYAHLSNIYVSGGETVTRGQLIGKMGSTGRSTGVHLHLEVHYKGVAVNPLAILK